MESQSKDAKEILEMTQVFENIYALASKAAKVLSELQV